MFDFLAFLPRAIIQSIPLLYGSTGETLTEKSGNLNLGIPGIMYVGAISGVVGSYLYEASPVREQIPFNGALAILIAVASCLIGSLLMGLIYCLLTVTLRANQNVTGLTLTSFGVGVGNFIGASLTKLGGNKNATTLALKDTSAAFCVTFPGINKAYVLLRTRPGLHLRAVGENPATADAAGISVNKYKYIATCIGSMIAGLGGLYYIMAYAGGIWSNDAFGDRGWLAIALVIFTIWRPHVGVLASFLFGGLYILHMYIPSGTNMAVKELYKMAPYVVTIIVLIISSIRNKREKQPPASLGLSYFREER